RSAMRLRISVWNSTVSRLRRNWFGGSCRTSTQRWQLRRSGLLRASVCDPRAAGSMPMSFNRRVGRCQGPGRTAIASTPIDLAPTVGPSLRLQLLLATACGICVANMYYAQPILGVIARDLFASRASAAVVVTVSQLGYAAGLLFLVSVGDIVERRKLVSWILPVAVAAAIGAAVAPSITVLKVAIAVLALCSVVAQILVPLAADMSGEAIRGRVGGLVMTGLLLGLLLSRTISGAGTEGAGWRPAYWVTAGCIAGMGN